MWTPEKIRDLRKRLQETQAEFAHHFRVSIQSVQTWEQGKGDPSGPVTVILDQLQSEYSRSHQSVGAGA